MNYKDKHLINQGAPDSFDLDNCPIYQEFLSKCDKDRLKQQMKNELTGDINEYFGKTTETTIG